MISPLINYGFGHVKGGLSPWHYMYFFAGAITILWSVVVYFYLPPDPIRAKGFTEREHFIAVSRLQSNNSGVRNTHFKKEQMMELLFDLKFWIMFMMTLLAMFANAPVSTFTVGTLCKRLFRSFLNHSLILFRQQWYRLTRFTASNHLRIRFQHAQLSAFGRSRRVFHVS